MQRYDPAAVEAKWQQVWEDAEAFTTPNPEPGEDASRLHVRARDAAVPLGRAAHGARQELHDRRRALPSRRRHGLRVLHPMGYDAFGLPAENAAIREGRHPRDVTNDNIAAIRKQMKRMGWSIDWSRELSTAEPEYYRWTQWIFLQLFERGLAYKREAPVNWCPVDQTVLANEQVIDGQCERCGSPVESRELEQWYFKITDYAQRCSTTWRCSRTGPSACWRCSATGSAAPRAREVIFHQRDLDEDDRRLHHAPRHAVRRDVLRRWRPSIRWSRGWSRAREHEARCWTTCAATPAPPRRSARSDKEKTGVDTGRTSPTRSTARRSRSGSPTTC